MMQCLSGCRLLSPIAQPRLGYATPTRAFKARRVVLVRAESASTSTSTAEPPVEPAAAASQEVALSPTLLFPSPSSTRKPSSAPSPVTIFSWRTISEGYASIRMRPLQTLSEHIKSDVQKWINVNPENRRFCRPLMSEEERRMYDWCLLRKATPTVDYAWPYESDLTQRLDDPTSLVAPLEDDGGNRKVAHFFLGWFVLSCILSIVVGMK